MDSLEIYRGKRNFGKTAEPSGEGGINKWNDDLIFVVQKHHARKLHYDFRLEWNGVLKSWAIPKGPSDLPSDKRLAVMTEDHPIEYASFEGEIPKGEYGGGTVTVWDNGTWTPEGEYSPDEALKKGTLKFSLNGTKLRGSWALARMGGSDNDRNWLLIKHKDKWASSTDAVPLVEREPDGVATGKTLEEPEFDLSEVPGIRKAKILSRPVKPELATLVDSVPQGDGWVHEVKYDGYRILARKTKSGLELLSRNDKSWTDKFSEIVTELEKLAENVILDGEVVVLDENGVSSFQLLQGALKGNGKVALTYYVFDMLWCRGQDFRGAPLLDRKAALRDLLNRSKELDHNVIRYSDHLLGNGEAFFKKACESGLEGIISKKADSPYRCRRTREWTKSKCTKRQEFVIGGFTEPSGSRSEFGALLLGVYDGHDLIYAGRVGTGFDEKSLSRIHGLLSQRVRKTPAFKNPPTGAERAGVTWTTPDLVGEVSFTEWTDESRLRHPSFQGLREDKRAADVQREREDDAPTPATAKKSSRSKRSLSKKKEKSRNVAGIEITHPDRVVFPDAEISKGDIAQYYSAVATHLLPYISDRPLSVLRCPDGRKQSCFYQKHNHEGMHEAVGAVAIEEGIEAEKYLTVNSEEGLVALAQFGVMELHPWLSRNDRLDRPDMMIFDLDPDDEVAWEEVLGAAFLLRDILTGFDLESFPKLTGGKGLHIVVPLLRRHDFGTVKPAAEAIAGELRDKNPGKFLITASKAKRKGKIFVDYLRNGRGSTAVAPFSVRARQGAPVAVPIGWDEVKPNLKPDQYDIKSVLRRLASLKKDPWEGMSKTRQSLTKSILSELGVD